MWRDVRGLGWRHSAPSGPGPTEVVDSIMPITAALDAWRTAEREWAAIDPSDQPRAEAAACEVVFAWLAYQGLAGTFDGQAVLVADRSGTFVAANDEAAALLGLPVPDIIGRTIADITAPGTAALREGMWQEFLDRGTMRGTYTVVGPDGDVVVEYDARAHHPLPGFFTSRLHRAG